MTKHLCRVKIVHTNHYQNHFRSIIIPSDVVGSTGYKAEQIGVGDSESVSLSQALVTNLVTKQCSFLTLPQLTTD